MSRTERILVVDDERLIRMTVRATLEEQGYEVVEAEDGTHAVDRLIEDDIDLAVLDYALPDMNGLDILRRVHVERPDTSVVMMTAHSSVEYAVDAIRLGAFDYLIKPVSHDRLLATIAKALEATRLRREVNRLRDAQRRSYGITSIIGRSKSMRDVFVLIRKIAESSAATVLIQGESGTGKDLVANAIHYASDRADKPFMNITCSALPETLLESELFGHERGAFTDARQQKKGLLELADGGTVFLDEIGEMGPQLQAKLLRFLEDKSFKRIGGSRDIHVDVRVIAATNIEITQAVRDSRFREDLFYRLNVVPIHLPPLKERPDDIPLLVDYFVDQFNRELRKNTRRVSVEAMSYLQRCPWPGNVRELRNCIERMMILESKAELDVADLPEEIVHAADSERGGRLTVGQDQPAVGESAAAPTGRVALPEGGVSLKQVERELVGQALERARGNQTQAARLLRISRDALRYKMKKFGLG